MNNYKDGRRKEKLLEKNDKNRRVMNLLKKADPKFAKHVFLKNELVEKFAEHEGGGLDILSQPVCENCEKVATWDTKGAYCFSCGHTTKEPMKVIKYLMEVLDGIDVEILRVLQEMEGGNDENIIR